MNNKLNEMWLALETLQQIADAKGYGEVWRQMCEQRTWWAATHVATTIDKHCPNESMLSHVAWSAANAAKAQADEEERIARPALLAQRAIDAIKEVKP